MTNARFWDYCNGGWVKLTLQPGQTLAWKKYEVTDEGSSFIAQNWIHQWDFVSYVEYSAGRDCDGLMEFNLTQRAKLGELDAIPLYEFVDGAERYVLNKPLWSTVKESQRDHSAEAAGY